MNQHLFWDNVTCSCPGPHMSIVHPLGPGFSWLLVVQDRTRSRGWWTGSQQTMRFNKFNDPALTSFGALRHGVANVRG